MSGIRFLNNDIQQIGGRRGSAISVSGGSPSYSFDFSSLPDGTMPSPWVGSGTAAISGGKAVLTPTLGAEILYDPGIETWASATDATLWLEGVSGTSTVNREATVKHGGNFAARLDVDGSNSNVNIVDSHNQAANVFYICSVWARADSGTPDVGIGPGATPNPTVFALTSSYAQYQSAWLATGVASFTLKRNSAAGRSLYFDDASKKTITTGTMLRVIELNTPNVIVFASGVGLSDLIWGVCAHVDDYTNPQNGLFAFGGKSTIEFYQLLSGAFTALIAPTAYSPIDGAVMKIIQNGTTAQLWYNGQQVSTDKTINAAIQTGKYHGIFSSSPSCSVYSAGMRAYA